MDAGTAANWVASNLLWELLRMAAVSLFPWAALRWAFGVFKSWRQDLAFWLTVPLGLTLTVLIAGGEYRRHLGLQEPKITGGIDRIHIIAGDQLAQVGLGGPSDVAVLVVANIRNAGTPTIADGYGLTVKVAGFAPIDADRMFFPGVLTLRTPGNGEVSYSPRDVLYNKTMAPIQRGALIRGVLLFRVRNVKHEDLEKTGTKYSLQFFDIDGRHYALEYEWPLSSRADMGYIPGLEIMPQDLCVIPTPTPTTTSLPLATPTKSKR